MEKKIILIFVVLLFAAGIAFAENNTTKSVEIEDSGNYILPVSITSEGIKFDDGFTGFCIDPSKSSIQTTDKFELGVIGSSEIENDIKLAIIECYKQGKEDAMADILSQINDKGSNNDVLSAVFSSNEKIGNTAVVEIDNTTEATFEFEFLKSTDDTKSDCVAYTVSMKTIEKEDVLAASDESADVQKTDNTTEDELTQNASDLTKENAAESDNHTDLTKGSAPESGNQSDLTKEDTSESGNQTDLKKATEDKNAGDNDTTTKETNKTIINKTNTVIVNENNTTVINHNNVKTLNDTPKNDTVQDLLKAGNPILILIIVIVVAVIVAVVVKRKD